ncbi:MAG TPA: hypothetical protein PKY88_05715 [Anaerohalosphaeraceae bacterium]|nr:hypothetical protein [Anaerohalosphaeraceae bacterium]
MRMQKFLFGPAAAVLVAGILSSAVFGQTILIDFGNASSWRGVTTPSPDLNGHYWNSVWSGAYYPNLLDINGNPTSIHFGFSIGGAGGTDSYNGPAGVTSNPPTPAQIAATDIDAAALGNLGIKEAAMDFYDSSRFEIQGLDPTKTYNLTFFGSHKYSDDDTTVYSVCTDNTYSSVVASASLKVADAPNSPNHNRDKVVTISDLDPQTFNILYVKFAGINGNLGYLNCMQIEEALPVKARSPLPRAAAKNVPLNTHLTWTAPSAYTPSRYVLRFRVRGAADPNWLVVDPVQDLAIDSDPTTTEAAVPISLDYSTTYEWKVSSFKAGDPNEFEGPIWSFTTVPALQVSAGPNILTWLTGGTAAVNLNGSVGCQCSPTVAWSVVSKPAGSNCVIANPASAVTWASLDKTGTYVLKLWARDNSIPIENEDTMEIQVFADACQAAKASPAGYIPLPHDSNSDCRVDLEDFVLFATDWLEDLSLTQNLEY